MTSPTTKITSCAKCGGIEYHPGVGISHEIWCPALTPAARRDLRTQLQIAHVVAMRDLHRDQ